MLIGQHGARMRCEVFNTKDADEKEKLDGLLARPNIQIKFVLANAVASAHGYADRHYVTVFYAEGACGLKEDVQC